MSVHRVVVSGKVKWDVRYRDDQGRNRSKRFDRKTGEGQADAFDAEMADLKRKGEVVDPDRGGMTAAKFWEDVFLTTRTGSGATRRQWKARWLPKRKTPAIWHVGKKWGNWKLRDLNRREVVMRWHAEMRQAGASQATIRSAHNLLVTIVSHAVDLEYLQRSRIEGFTLDYTPKRFEDPWVPEQVERIRNHLLAKALAGITGQGGANRHADGEEYKWRRRRDAELVSFMGYQGPRPGEAHAVTWERVLNAERTSIGTAVGFFDSVREEDEEFPDDRERTKTGNDRTVTLEKAVRDDLLAWWMFCGKPSRGLVFPVAKKDIGVAGAEWTTVGLSNWRQYIWNPTVEAVGLPKRSPKHLRHSCVSMWIREGLSLKDVADRAGHTMVVCERHYAHAFNSLDPHDKFTIAEAIAAARRSGDNVVPLRATAV